MKTRLSTATIRSFSLVCALLLLMAAWGFSIAAAQQDQKNTEQTTANPPPAAASGEAQQAQPAPQSPEQTTANPPPAAAPGEAQQAQPAPQSPEQMVATQPPGAAAPQPEGAAWNCPPEYIPLIQKTTASLLAANFTFIPVKALDPFIPFISLSPGTQRSPEEEDEPQGGAPLTPLQKMTLSEIERGLKAITWGELGTRAVIEDSTGRGYIVAVGTPAGEHGGVIKEIMNDRLVIQQEIWDRKAKKRYPQDFTIKLVKKTDQKS